MGQMTMGQVEAACQHLRMLDLSTISSGLLMERAIDLSRRLDHAIYDCLYLACAEREGATLVTANVRFARKQPEGMTRIVTLDGVRAFVPPGNATPPS